MTITVSRDDIKQGRRCDCTGCPVAVALRRSTGVAWLAQPAAAAWFPAGSDLIRVPLPESVAVFMKAFDRGEDVPTFTFAFDWSPEAQQ